MDAFRHRLASGALLLIALQLAVVFAAPMACCVSFGSGSSSRSSAAATRIESHTAADECPLHKSKELGSTSKAPDSPCRMMCDAPHGSLVLLGAIGLLPAPGSTHVDI